MENSKKILIRTVSSDNNYEIREISLLPGEKISIPYSCSGIEFYISKSTGEMLFEGSEFVNNTNSTIVFDHFKLRA